MNFFRCDDCGHVFADGEGATVKDDMGVTDPFPVYKMFIACPECLCEDLDDFDPCDTDDCENEAMQGFDYCAECQAAIDAEESRCLAEVEAEECGDVCQEIEA